MQNHPWKNKVAVITGAGSGIGRAISRQLARRGCHISLVDVDQTGLDETKTKLQSCQGKFTTHRIDVSDKAQMQLLPDMVIAEHGQVDMIFNNAGITIEKPFNSHSIEEWELMIGINIWGVIYGCKYFLPYLKQRPEAFIINTSSLAGFLGIPTQSSYCLTKAAVKVL
ncbi:MAG: SDR family oxidoreductase, partial [Spirochaetales bacterium]